MPQSWCENCRICCRFPAPENVQAPTFSDLEVQWALKQGVGPDRFEKIEGSPSSLPKLESCGSGHRCPAFESTANRCTLYPVRPLDCRVYPFVLTRDSAGTRALLSMDMKCPYIEKHGSDPQVLAYAVELTRYLETQEGLAYLKSNPHLLGKSWPEFVAVAALPTLRRAIREEPTAPPHPMLESLSLKEEALLKSFLLKRPHTHSGYTAAGLLGWIDLIRLWQVKLEDALCLFAEQGGGFFMPVPPLAEELRPAVLKKSWEILTELNRSSGVSRVEGIEANQAPVFKSLGFKLIPGEAEYLYERKELVELRGDRYRSKRGDINKALRGSAFVFRPFEKKDLTACLQLYTHWGIERQRISSDPYLKALIRDGLFFHRRLMINPEAFNLTGRVLEIEGEIRGYTFGAAVNPDLFVVFLEITDRKIPGLNPLIFREFCRELASYRWINAMGDSSLPGLRQVKESYRPLALNLIYQTRGSI